MASIQKKGDAWYCQFIYVGHRHTFTVGKVDQTEAGQWKARTEHLLMRVKQRMLIVPDGVDIADFIFHDGKASPSPAISAAKQTTLRHLRQAYETTFSNGAFEPSTHYTARIHLQHIEDTFGPSFLLSGLSTARLQEHNYTQGTYLVPGVGGYVV